MTTRPTFEQLKAEEIPLQSAAVDLEGGSMPTCLTLFERYFKCFGAPHLPLSALEEKVGSIVLFRRSRPDCALLPHGFDARLHTTN